MMIAETRLSLELLKRVEALNADHWSAVKRFIENLDHHSIAKEHEACLQKRHVDLGFNVFAIVSDLYYRENFHSDILCALLSPASAHGEGCHYLHLFLEWLNRNGATVDLAHFRNACVVREEGRVDILISDETSKRAVIIENKINGAADMLRQIPRYLEYVEGRGLQCDAVVYLRLNHARKPDRTEWTPEDNKRVDARLVSVVAYNETETDLLRGWIRRCQAPASNPDAALIFRHYGELVHKLGANIMNKPIMERFYAAMLDGDNYNSARSLVAMLDDLVLFRVEKIIDEFKSNLHPFKNVANHQGWDAYFTGVLWNGAHLGLDVWVEADCYRLQFWDRDDRDGSKGLAKAMVMRMGAANEFKQNGGLYQKELRFPAHEGDLIPEIKSFKERLASALAECPQPPTA
jgi:hypothetical protein